MAKISDDHIRWVLDMDAKGVQSELTKLSSQSQKFVDDNKRMNAELKEAEKQMKEAEKEMTKLTKAGKENSSAFRQAEVTYEAAADEITTYKQKIRENTKAIEQNNKRHTEMIRTMRIEDMTMGQLEQRARSLNEQLKNTSQSASPDTYRQLSAELTVVKNRMVELDKGSQSMFSTFKGGLAVFAGNMMTKAIEGVKRLYDSAKEWIAESILAGRSSEGVVRAFERLGDSGDLLEKLRTQTRGLIGDFELMQAAVKADKYKIPAEEVGNLLEFASRRAIDMGQNVDDFQKRIINGIGKQSKLILDDLGLSSTEINKAIAKEGNFAKGVISIVNEELEKQGPLALTAADMATQASVKWKNRQGEIGDQLLWIDKLWSTFSGKVADWVGDFTQNTLPKLMQKLVDLYNWMVDFHNNSTTLRAVIAGTVIQVNTLWEVTKYFLTDAFGRFKLLGNMVKGVFTLDWDLMKNAAKDFFKVGGESLMEMAKRIKENTQEAYADIQNNQLQYYSLPQKTNNNKTIKTKNDIDGLTDEELKAAAKKQKEELNLMLENLETKHQDKLYAIKKKYSDGGLQSESDFNQKTFAQEQAYYLLREETLTTFLKKVTDKELKSDISKQITVLQNKRLNAEIKFRAELEKIILDANPEAKEKKEYEDRLRSLGIFGVSVQELKLKLIDTQDEAEQNKVKQQIEALELLEKQHQDNLLKIMNDARNKQKAASEEQFNESFKNRKEQLQQEIAQDEQSLALGSGIGSLSGNNLFDAEVALQQKRIALLQEEVEARQKAGLEVSKIMQKQRSEELALTNLYTAEYKRRTQQYNQYGTQLGDALGSVLTGQETALKGFGNVVLDIMFDTLSKIINAKIAEATAVAIAEQAKAAAISAAQPDSVVTFGASAIARTAAIGAIIMGALAAAKSALKGMLNKNSSSTDTSTATTTTRNRRIVKQQAEGKYDVIGASDGQLYRNVPYEGIAQTGVVAQPTLVGERGSELVVSHTDFMALKKHINYPIILQALNDARSGRVNQRADGKYDRVDGTDPSSSGSYSSFDVNKLQETLDKVGDVLSRAEKNGLGVNYRKFGNAQDTMDYIRKLASRK